MINFASLVLGPAMNTFARPIIVLPLASQPGQPAYAARGVLRVENPDIATEQGIYSAHVRVLTIRLSEFTVLPEPQDQVIIPAHLGLPASGTQWIDDTDDDDQGGRKLFLKDAQPQSAGP